MLKHFKFNKEDLPLSFSLIESRMALVGVKKQWSKFTVLNDCLPMEYITEVRSIVIKSQADFADGWAYKSHKTETRTLRTPSLRSE